MLLVVEGEVKEREGQNDDEGSIHHRYSIKRIFPHLWSLGHFATSNSIWKRPEPKRREDEALSMAVVVARVAAAAVELAAVVAVAAAACLDPVVAAVATRRPTTQWNYDVYVRDFWI